MSNKDAGVAVVLAAVTMLLAGCSHAVRGYTLRRQAGTDVLIPPGSRAPLNGTIQVRLLRARKGPFPPVGCEINSDPIVIQWRGGMALVEAKPDSGLLGFGGDSTKEGQLSLDPLKYINDLRGDIIGLESKGCLHPGESQALAANIAQKLPFQPFLAYLLRFGAFDLNQFIDLTPDFRLRVVYPIYSADNQAEPKEVKGADTVYYKIVPDQIDGRVRISQAATKEAWPERGTPEGPAKRITSPFPSSPSYFRLFLKKSNSSKDPVTVAIILGSGDREHLDRATKELDGSDEPSCRFITASKTTCILFPALTGVNAEIRVTVNGKEAFARLGAQVNEVIREVGTDDVPRFVQVKRLFDNRLVPIRADSDNKALLALILVPGDVVNYR